MIIEDGAHLGKHEAEEAQFGGAPKKQRWEASESQLAGDIESQAKELLAWELEQEQWAEESDAANQEDPQWPRGVIGRVQSTPPFSDRDEDHPVVTSGRQSPLIKMNNQKFAEPSRPAPTIPRGSISQNGPDAFFLEHQGTSPFSNHDHDHDEDRQPDASGRQSPMTKTNNQASVEPTRPPMSPRESILQHGPDAFFLEDQRTVQNPLSPGMLGQGRRTAQQPMSPGMSVRSSHQLEAALSPTATPQLSPSPSVRSSTSAVGRYTSPESNYLLSPQPRQTSGHVPMQASDSNTHFKVFGQETLGMRMRSFSPPAIILQSSSFSGRYAHEGAGNDHFRVDDSIQQEPGITARIASAYHHPSVPHSASWNNIYSQHNEADKLEAEFARLESGRDNYHGFEERDEQNATRSAQGQKMGYELEELEQEYERLEIRNQEVIAVSQSLEKVPSDGVIHLEDQASLESDDIEMKTTPPHGVGIEDLESGFDQTVRRKEGIEDLEAEFDEAVRRKEALLRTCSMDSNEGDGIFGDREEAPKEELPKKRAIPIRKSIWQEKLERFERRGLADAEARLDVSKYPRLQQIRQRRRERLKALMAIRQERAEIWNTLEANWEQMENSMSRRLATEPKAKNRGQDPEPTSPKKAPPTDPDQVVGAAMNDASQTGSLKLSTSVSVKETEEPKEEKEAVKVEEPETAATPAKPGEVPASEPGKDVASSIGNTEPVTSVADLVEDLVESSGCMVRHLTDGNDSPRGASVGVERAITPKTVSPRAVSSKSITNKAVSPKAAIPSVERAVSPTTTRTSDAIPASTVSLLESITGTASDMNQKTKASESNEPTIPKAKVKSETAKKTAQKEDPPPSFGAYISQSMSDVGTKVVQILKSVRSNEEQSQPQEQEQSEEENQHPTITAQGTDTYEEEASQLGSTLTDEARDDDETSNGLGPGVDVFGFEEEDPELEHQACVHPLKNLIRNPRRIIVDHDVADQGCINPLVHLGFGGGSQLCVPRGRRKKAAKGQVPGFIQPLPTSCSDLKDDGAPQDYVGPNQSEEEQQKFKASARSSQQTSHALTSKKSKRSKKAKHKKPAGGVDSFFTLVDDLLVNKILNIMDEKVVDNVAHTFGFD